MPTKAKPKKKPKKRPQRGKGIGKTAKKVGKTALKVGAGLGAGYVLLSLASLPVAHAINYYNPPRWDKSRYG